MTESLYKSAAFIFAESSFLVVASIATYELLIGDYVWAQQEETRRTALKRKQSLRGRGDSSFDSRRILQQQLYGPPRSLSPGGRRQTPRGGAAYHNTSSRRGVAPTEETSLLYPQPYSRENSRERRTVVEEVHYASPGETRFTVPGRGSTGDTSRRMFYKVILLALITRLVLLPLETFCLSQMNALSTTHTHLSIVVRIILRISQTLPDVAFASALAFLIIFCAKIAFSAMPPLTSDNEKNMIVSTEPEVIDKGITDRKETTPIILYLTTRKLQKFRLWIASAVRLSQTIFASEKTFVTWNILLSTSYLLIFVLALALPNVSLSIFEIWLWIFFATIYSFLLLSLAYAATLLGTSLFSGIDKQMAAGSLAMKMAWTCALLSFMTIIRAGWFSDVAYHAIVDNNTQNEKNIQSQYKKIAIEYVISESIPILFILALMHRKRKGVTNDVIIHSILSNLFGSSGKLTDSNIEQSVSVESLSPAENGGGGQSSRKFPIHFGGAYRGDSFPPADHKSTLDIPRAFSSDSKV